MRFKTIAQLALLAALALPPGVAFGADGPAFRQATEADLALNILPYSATATATNAASELEAEAHCGQTIPRLTLVDLSWQRASGTLDASGLDDGTSADRPGANMRVDISKLREGFTTGSFETTGLFPASLGTVTVGDAEPGVRYYWRVLSSGVDGWTASPVRRFRAPVCKADALEADQLEALGITSNLAPSNAPATEEG